MKLETTSGVDAAPVVGTDDVFVTMDSSGIKNGVTQVANEPASPTGFEYPAAVSTIKPNATYRMPLYGKGLSTGRPVLPKWLSVPLATLGHVNRNQGTSGSKVVWSMDTTFPRTTAFGGTVTASDETFTIYDYVARDGSVAAGTKILQKMVGCRVVALRLVFVVGQWAMMEIDVQGIGVQPVAVTTDLGLADLDDVKTDFVRVNGATTTLTLDGNDTVLNSQSTTWTCDFGGTQEEGDSAVGGVACVGLRQGLVTGSLNPILATGDIDLFAAAQNDQELCPYSMASKMTPQGRTVDTGYSIEITIGSVQLTFEFDATGSVVRLPTTAKAVSADGTTTPITISLS
jgi:hypothetical protein